MKQTYVFSAPGRTEISTFTPENITGILQEEVGLVFAQVLEHAGVHKRTAEGRAAFLRFVETV